MKLRLLFYLFVYLSKADAFDKNAYKVEDIKEYSNRQVSNVKKQRKDGGVSETLGLSFSTLPGKKIQANAITGGCKNLSQKFEYFLKMGTNMSAFQPEIKKLSGKECSLTFNKETYTVISQTEVAEHIEFEAKNGRTSGTAFLLYLGVSNDQAVYLLNKFETLL